MTSSTPPHKRVLTLPEQEKRKFYDFFAINDDIQYYSKLLYDREDPSLPSQPKQEPTGTLIPPPKSLLLQPQPVSQRAPGGAIVPYVRREPYPVPQIIVNNYNINTYGCDSSCNVAANPTVGEVDQNQIVIGDGEGKEQEEKKNVKGHWTREEHKLFLRGLVKYGWGKWSQIKKEFLPNRKAHQVASHAQKHMAHLNDRNNKNKPEKKRKLRRSSIFQMHEEEDQTDPEPQVLLNLFLLSSRSLYHMRT